MPSPSPFPYTVQPGQCFFVIEAGVQAAHYYTWSFDDTYDRFTVVGNKRYVWVQYNARQAFVEESLVEEITVR